MRQVSAHARSGCSLWNCLLSPGRAQALKEPQAKPPLTSCYVNIKLELHQKPLRLEGVQTCGLFARASAWSPRRQCEEGLARRHVAHALSCVSCSRGPGSPQRQFPGRKPNPLHVDPGHAAALRAGRAEDLRPQVPRLRPGSPRRVTPSFRRHPNPVFLAPQARGRPHRHRHLRGGGRGEAERLQGRPGRAGPARRHRAGLRPELGARGRLLR